MVDERETRALRSYLGSRPELVTSRLALVEVARASALSNPHRDDMPARVDRLLSSCKLIDVSAPVLRDARRLASVAVGTLDAIHLASALRVEADELVAYDRHLLAAADAHGLRAASPGA